ncbi:peptidyl-prolyl cis-trans isomerase A (cyclophilin A) [Methylobacillus rhizosphaerae]|uniref:Peptidyl-prolyl cis-trans isomerase n=1 Tax=Methylobacillus rhizosphaerae TaxID=551994 RepID=A0A239A005_9PROT|nr:peptidylprolyl isomerase [Methylobacillus rhizosphaerae]SNR88223.1 peptidyl-prolyl cis-trans isomerase A (cyclophilin A) [Methylobacillus rhizosphaerae]
MRAIVRALSTPFLSLAILVSSLSALAAGTPPQIEVQTNHGNFIIELYPEKAPKTVENFIQYVTSDFYTGTTFHRTVDRFMIQGGGLTAEMQEKSTFSPIENESNNGLKNEYGSIAMARAFAPDSATSQFFINLSDNKFLNFHKPEAAYIGYCVFGKVIKGIDVVEKISKSPTKAVGAHLNVPVEPVVIEHVAILDQPINVAERLDYKQPKKLAQTAAPAKTTKTTKTTPASKTTKGKKP